MKSFLAIFWLIIGSAFFSGQVFAQQNCPAVNTVKKWEVISIDKLLAYDSNDQYYFFMKIPFMYGSNAPKAGGSITLRFFSSTICRGDTIIVNGTESRVESIEGIRR